MAQVAKGADAGLNDPDVPGIEWSFTVEKEHDIPIPGDLGTPFVAFKVGQRCKRGVGENLRRVFHSGWKPNGPRQHRSRYESHHSDGPAIARRACGLRSRGSSGI